MEAAERGDLVVVQCINGVMAGTVTRVDDIGLVIGWRPFGARRSVRTDETAIRNFVPRAEIDLDACRETAKKAGYYFADFAAAREAFKPHAKKVR